MATEEHKQLASVIKNTHALLREECKIYGAEEAWKRHVDRNDILQKYSTSMRKLATTYWQERNTKLPNGVYCRVEWVKSQCKEYFFNGGMVKYESKELEIKRKISTDSENSENSDRLTGLNLNCLQPNNTNNDGDSTYKVQLLDVGSCYDPFGKDEMFEVMAIDLVPVSDTVLQCDFLKVNIGKDKVFSDSGKKLDQLPESSFDAVVFSLLLEYFPCPQQRYLCCKKAYDLLKFNGILFIISPDSKHVGANAKFMKSWRFVLSKMGFMRVKYEKLQHIHCVAFRKCLFPQVALRWTSLQTFAVGDPLFQSDNKIFIPQDFNNFCIVEQSEDDSHHYNTDELVSAFTELPLMDEI